MRLPKVCRAHRRVLVPLMVVVGLVSLAVVSLPFFETSDTETTKPLALHVEVDPQHRKLVHTYVHSVLQAECQPSYARRSLLARLPASSLETTPFLSSKDAPLPNHLFLYPPPFGFKGLRRKLEDLLKLLPDSDSTSQLDTKQECQRCVVMGNGGILRGLQLGPLIDRFDTVIRLNSGPLGEFSVDVGNRTSIRMSYPEGTPHQWPDTDPRALFVAVVYKAADLSWISAIVNRHAVPLWDWLFFWQKVPEQLPLDPKKIRLLNLEVIREASVDLLQFPPPKFRLWGWDQNVPTLGVTALNLASLLCDEVSLAGFGYNLSQRGAPLHYYDRQPMEAMLGQTMHDVDRERALLSGLAREGAVSDLTGGLHCSFCHSSAS